MRVAFIGGGASSVAAYLEITSRLAPYLSSMTIFDPKGVFNSEPFNTDTDVTLLNTSVGLTSIVSRNSMDFLSWLWEYHPELDAKPESFLPRRLLREYALSRFSTAKRYLESLSCPTSVIRKEVTDLHGLSSGNLRVETAGLMNGPYDVVILGTGHGFKQPFDDVAMDPDWIATPYPESELLKRVEGAERVLVLGTMLSAIDAALTIFMNTEKTEIVLASSSGMLPAVRSEFLFHPTEAFCTRRLVQRRWPSLLRAAERAMVADLRRLSVPSPERRKYPTDPYERLKRDIENCEAGRINWQRAIVSFALETNELWSYLSLEEQRKLGTRHREFFKRFVTSFPLENAKRIAAAIDSGRLTVRAITRDKPFRRTCSKRLEGVGPLAGLSFDKVVNATGLAPLAFREQTLYRNLLAGRSLLNAHGGLDVDTRTMRLTGAGRDSRVYVTGAPAVGSMFVTNFLPGTVVQASRIADDIADAVSFPSFREVADREIIRSADRAVAFHT